MTAKGLPFSERGGIFVDVSTLRFVENSDGTGDGPISSIDILARIPVADRTFVEANLPLAAGTLGNPTAGVRHVFRLADPVWLTLGAAMGFPVVNTEYTGYAKYARAGWDIQAYAPLTMPFSTRLAFEAHPGLAEIRAELNPVWGVAVNDEVGHFLAVQHAFEAQLGHAFGGGVRYQGVAIATEQRELDEDHYQGTVAFFLRLMRGPILARMDFMLPLDTPLGKGRDDLRTWGVQAKLGWTLD